MRLWAGMLALALAACVSTEREAAPFDPAACYERDFSIYFEGFETDLTADAREVMDLQGAALRGCAIGNVRIIGQADALGGQETNRAVSVRRAEVIADYLAQRVGWPRSHFELLATGERGAVTDEGLNVPVRNRARIIVQAAAP